jgi:multicomponent Na+:H+ antiporter subunit D
MVLAVFLPILGSLPIFLLPWKREVHWKIYAFALTLLTSGLVWRMILSGEEQSYVLFRFANDLEISFGMDGLARVFAGLVSFLWPLALLYAFEYMEHLQHQRIFFLFYVMTYGVTLGIALSGNILTMYCFYEMLTMVTLPLIMHPLTPEAISASRTYVLYSLGGAAFAFIGMVFILY